MFQFMWGGERGFWISAGSLSAVWRPRAHGQHSRMRMENSEQPFYRRYAIFKCLHEKVFGLDDYQCFQTRWIPCGINRLVVLIYVAWRVFLNSKMIQVLRLFSDFVEVVIGAGRADPLKVLAASINFSNYSYSVHINPLPNHPRTPYLPPTSCSTKFSV